jgi:hypothetical protein
LLALVLALALSLLLLLWYSMSVSASPFPAARTDAPDESSVASSSRCAGAAGADTGAEPVPFT